VRTTVTSEDRHPACQARHAAAFVAAGLLAFAVAAPAHHSFAMFDMSKSSSTKGTIKELQWTNPHVWIELTVEEKGKPVTYGYEGAAIAVLKRVGWTKDSVKAGDVVTIVGHPFRDGRPGGSIDYLILADGSKLGTGDAIPGALRVPGVE
jgi:hypothetical protein